MNKSSVLLFGLIASISAACAIDATEPGSAEESEPAESNAQELTGWLGPISDEAAYNNRSFSQANIAATNAYCSGSYCDNNYLYGSALPSGVLTGTEHPRGQWISEESPNNQSFCVDSLGYLNGVITGLRASGNYSDNLELICAPLSFRSGRWWGSCRWTGWFSEENGGYPSGWPGGYYATGMACRGSNCDNVRYYVCQFN